MVYSLIFMIGLNNNSVCTDSGSKNPGAKRVLLIIIVTASVLPAEPDDDEGMKEKE